MIYSNFQHYFLQIIERLNRILHSITKIINIYYTNVFLMIIFINNKLIPSSLLNLPCLIQNVLNFTYFLINL